MSSRETERRRFEDRVTLVMQDFENRRRTGKLSPGYRPEYREAMLRMAEDGSGHLKLKPGTKQTFLFYAWPGVNDQCPFLSMRNTRAAK